MQPVQSADATVLNDAALQSILQYARECLMDIPHATKMDTFFPFRDRFAHSRRVMGWCERLLGDIPARRDIVLAAAALHDIGYTVSASDHALHGSKMAEGFLTEMGLAPEQIQNIVDLIAKHSDKQLNPVRMSNELMILQDADCLDEIGAMTVLWDSLAEGAEDVQSYEKAYRRIAKSYQHLTGRGRRMKTQPAQALYEERLAILENFIHELEYVLFL